MNKTSLCAAVILLGVLSPFDSAFAGYMRCSGYIIDDGLSNGHTKYEILKKCGEPTERHGNTWIYQKSGRFTRTLRFSPDGKLVSVQE